MALFSRRRRLPDDLRRALDLRSDAILASTPLDDGRWAVATRRALHVVGPSGAARTPWADVDRGALDAESRTLTVHWVNGARTDLVLASDVDAWDLVQTFRERVQQSVVHVEHVPVGATTVRVALRRDEHGDLFTQVIGDAAVDLADPAMVRRLADAEARVRAEAGLAP
ncbi:hypothetical protein J1G42_09460 [Cellulomonas sp. zg-ZUI222]|uniref:Uncharacterized protein n=1 Tax=Cellulomonas wangleii TaxID=2816956 RepID=A0ABX8D3M6_9CELL|nr:MULTISPECIES: hypothetical protein [Cellulomonas]MBO0900034.1 hypothetical protein [Cellulomonas sp. zg-ZUI22]MBO0921051.1 hypothetical protein [Cellulomonas wangleii]MBO0925467.1 hypothetical protein [Cellulomonas wangleii]QVI61061.1 hypothetical protein KG103_11055 [Cellulomonas wangleii]